MVATISTSNSGGGNPAGIAVTPDGSTVYVADEGSNNVSVIATATNNVVATVGTGAQVPFAVAITPDGSKVYVTNQGVVPGTGTVSVIATATNSVVAIIPVGSFPLGVAVTPDGRGLCCERR